jgi:hypothetical protein
VSRKRAPEARPKVVHAGWAGFPTRLKYAVDERRRQNPWLTQNAIAERADYDSGNLTRLLQGSKVDNLTANTALLLAVALHVEPNWLLNGVEPSGLDRPLPSELYAPLVEVDDAGRKLAAKTGKRLESGLKRPDPGDGTRERSD